MLNKKSLSKYQKRILEAKSIYKKLIQKNIPLIETQDPLKIVAAGDHLVVAMEYVGSGHSYSSGWVCIGQGNSAGNNIDWNSTLYPWTPSGSGTQSYFGGDIIWDSGTDSSISILWGEEGSGTIIITQMFGSGLSRF